MNLLEFNNVTKSFRTDFWKSEFKALDSLSFAIKKEKIIGFLGANGAGKTTSIKILLDFIKADSGDITFSKSLGLDRSSILNNIGYVPERPYFYPHLTGIEFALYMASLHSISKKTAKDRIFHWAKTFKIDFALDRKIKGYSKGMLQRLGFLCSLVHEPQLLVLDEPLSGLDPMGRKEFKDAIRLINNEGKTVFFSSHIVSDVEEVSSEVVFLEDGKLIYQGDIDSLIAENSKNTLTVRYFAEDEINDPFLEKISCKKIKGKNIFTAKLHSDQKDKVINLLLDKKASIHELYQDKISLEEIIYRVKS